MQHFNKDRLKHHVLCFVPALCLVSVFAFPRIADNGLTLMEIVIDMLCLATFASIFSRILDSKKSGSINTILDLYDEQCDPHSFVQKAKPYVDKLKVPYDELGVWVVAPYAMALADVDRLEEAKEYANKVLESGKSATSDYGKASMLVNMEPLVLRLSGIEPAIQLLDEAERLVEQETTPTTKTLSSGKSADSSSSRGSYIRWRKDLLSALLANDDNRLIPLLKKVRTGKGFSRRLRVLCAIDEAAAHYRRSDVSRERDCLDFVIENGNLLPCVEVARKRIEQLDEQASSKARSQ